jgi:hypothetical protein
LRPQKTKLRIAQLRSHLDHPSHFFKTSDRSKPTKTDSGLENEGGMVILLSVHRIGVERGGDIRARFSNRNATANNAAGSACASKLTGSGRHGGMKW